ncbi:MULTISPECIES: O-antigen ligase family protein [unclassified Sinorhizobium]|uniref:O-antigen ligase family protein n=1 Tax=unclassified Sinorhizobium TaxID=2613772 RepID=UPI003526AAB3
MEMRLARPVTGILCLLWLIAATPTLVESDAYRYALGIVYLITFYVYCMTPERPRTTWLAWLCIGWGFYAAARFAAMYFFSPDHQLGASEWLYIFPVFFPMLGFGFSLTFSQIEKMLAAFFAVALVFLLVMTPYATVLAGEAITPLIQHNRIHGAVSCGLMTIGAFFWLRYYLRSGTRSQFARFAVFAAPLVMILCLFNIYGSKSKGVWLAMVAVLPILALFVLNKSKRKAAAIAVGSAALVLGAGVYAARTNLYETAGPTIVAAAPLLEGTAEGNDVDALVSTAIDSPDTPTSMGERLQLWSNAWEVFSASPIFGAGNQWLSRWHQTRYAKVKYTLLHNGYFEILVRHGLFGAAIFSIMLYGFFLSVWRASQKQLIAQEAFYAYGICILFFAITILSNSNNRLAIGESLALISSAFACYCNQRLDALRFGQKKPSAQILDLQSKPGDFSAAVASSKGQSHLVEADENAAMGHST